MIVESYEDVIVLSGVLRSNFWETIHTAIALTLKRHRTGVIIDCSGITECTREGADTFVDVMAFIESHDARIIVAAVPPAVMEVLKSVPEVRSQLPIAASVEEARHSLDLLEGESPVKKKATQASGLKRLLVYIDGGPGDEQVLKISRQLAQANPYEVALLVSILVPRDLPLQSPLPELEDAATEILGRGKAALDETDIVHSIQLERARDVAGAIEAALEQVSPTKVVLALPADPDRIDAALKLAKSVMTRVPIPIVFVRPAP